MAGPVRAFTDQPPAGGPPGAWAEFGFVFTDIAFPGQEQYEVLVPLTDIASYPTPYTNLNGDTVNAGFPITWGSNFLDDSAPSGDIRFAGFQYGGGNDSTWRMQTGPGNFSVYSSGATGHDGQTYECTWLRDGGNPIVNTSPTSATRWNQKRVSDDGTEYGNNAPGAAAWEAAYGTNRIALNGVVDNIEVRANDLPGGSWAFLASIRIVREA